MHVDGYDVFTRRLILTRYGTDFFITLENEYFEIEKNTIK